MPGPSRIPYALAVADLNADQRLDVVVGYIESRGSVFFSQGKAAFREVLRNDGKGDVYAVAFADLNEDDMLDIVAARSGAPNAIWFGNAPPK